MDSTQSESPITLSSLSKHQLPSTYTNRTVVNLQIYTIKDNFSFNKAFVRVEILLIMIIMIDLKVTNRIVQNLSKYIDYIYLFSIYTRGNEIRNFPKNLDLNFFHLQKKTFQKFSVPAYRRQNILSFSFTQFFNT